MYQNKLLCYKVSYCLGVSDDILQSDFPELHEIAKAINYWDKLPTVREFRAIARIYYTVIRHCELYTKDKSFTVAAGHRFDAYVENTGIAPEVIFQDAESTSNFICKLAEMAQQRITAVYAELKPALDYLSFAMLMRLQPVTDVEMQRLQYILRRTSFQYNIYFFESALFNVATKEMLQMDAFLRKCIGLVTGRTMFKGLDTSDLARELDRRDDGYFVTVSSMAQTYKNIFLLQKDVTPEQQTQILTLFSDESLSIRASADCESFMKLWDEQPAIRENCVVLARTTQKDIQTLQEHCPGLSQVLLIPIARTLYRRILTGEFDSVAMLSLR